VQSNKQLHGWWPGKRECTAERLLINPYNGCSVGCFYCYTKALWGYFQTFVRRRIITVWKKFDHVISKQLNEIRVASCGYLSPVTDPFQTLNSKYQLTEKIIKQFVSRNIPIEFITKNVISEEALRLIKLQKHSFGQVSILTLREKLRKHLSPGGASTEELLKNFQRLKQYGRYAVCRIDPIIPFVTDRPKELENLIKASVEEGADHIVASCLDIPKSIYNEVIHYLSRISPQSAYDYRKLYNESMGNSFHADIKYRKGIFTMVREICDRIGVTFALCMEFELIDGVPVGLNREFMSSTNCEGMDIPIYVRVNGVFQPACDCSGACLTCKEAKCGIEELAMGNPSNKKKDWKLQDYKRWSHLFLPSMKIEKLLGIN
jgi:DNA repair photolyase